MKLGTHVRAWKDKKQSLVGLVRWGMTAFLGVTATGATNPSLTPCWHVCVWGTSGVSDKHRDSKKNSGWL